MIEFIIVVHLRDLTQGPIMHTVAAHTYLDAMAWWAAQPNINNLEPALVRRVEVFTRQD